MSTENNLKSMSDLLIRACNDNVLDPIGVIQEVLSLIPSEVALNVIDECFTDILEEAYNVNSENS